MPVDLYHDPAHGRLKALLGQYPGVAARLKTASFEDALDALPDTAFAWPTRRLFPVHAPEQALVSYLYARAPDVPPHVKLAVAEALHAYGVPGDALAPAPPPEDAPADLLFPENGTYPVRSATEVKTAEERLLTQLDRLPLDRRVPVFAKLAQAAVRHGVELQPATQAWGMAALSDPGVVLDGLAARAHLAKTAEAKETYRRAAEGVRADPTALRQPALRAKLAALLLRADETAGLVPEYGRRLPDPFHTVYNRPVKLGTRLVTLGPEAYDVTALVALPATFYRDALGPEFVGELAPGGQVDPEALATVLPTLPADLKASLAGALRQAGVPSAGV